MPNSHNWPGDWYVYEDGRISGPLAAEEAFCLDNEAPSGKPRMISRKGFSQWYALKDLSEIFRLTENLGRKIEKSNDEVLKHSQPDHNQTTEIKPKLIRGQISTKSAPNRPTSSITQTPNLETKSTPDKAPEPTALPSPTTESPTISAESVPTPNSPQTLAPSSGAKSITATLMQEYLILRSKLHLGKIKNPWILAFGGLPATFGLLWAFWIHELSLEVSDHCKASSKNKVSPKIPPAFLAMVPLVHFFIVWRLAKIVIAMENQNRYQSVSAWYAVTLAIFPPLTMVYLQDAANKHWLLHVRHSIAKSSSASLSKPVANDKPD